jgi:hypothetical protein
MGQYHASHRAREAFRSDARGSAAHRWSKPARRSPGAAAFDPRKVAHRAAPGREIWRAGTPLERLAASLASTAVVDHQIPQALRTATGTSGTSVQGACVSVGLCVCGWWCLPRRSCGVRPSPVTDAGSVPPALPRLRSRACHTRSTVAETHWRPHAAEGSTHEAVRETDPQDPPAHEKRNKDTDNFLSR